MRGRWWLAVIVGATASVVMVAQSVPPTSPQKKVIVKGFADVVGARHKQKQQQQGAAPSRAAPAKVGAPQRMPSHPSKSNAATAQSSGAALVRTARRYLGLRYRYGGSSPSRGFDCSGFVYFLLSRYGIRAPRTAAELFRMGVPVKKSALRPGDLVFFRNTARRRGITHVGIYIGDGKFIHASSGRGRVTVTPLSDPYYAARFAGARRLPVRGGDGK